MSTIVKWTPEVIESACSAAIAVAEFWDALRVFELESGVEFDGTLKVVESLAAACDTPPSPENLSDDQIIAALDDLLDIEGAI